MFTKFVFLEHVDCRAVLLTYNDYTTQSVIFVAYHFMFIAIFSGKTDANNWILIIRYLRTFKFDSQKFVNLKYLQ